MGAVAGREASEEGSFVEELGGEVGHRRPRRVVWERGQGVGIGLVVVVVFGRVEGEGGGERRIEGIGSGERTGCNAGGRVLAARRRLGINIQQEVRERDRSDRMIEAMEQGSLVVFCGLLWRCQRLLEIPPLGVDVAPELVDAPAASPVTFFEGPTAAGRLGRDFGFDGLHVCEGFVACASGVVGYAGTAVEACYE